MFHDEKNNYPSSSVEFVWFPHFSLREMFGYLREKEFVLQQDLKNARGTNAELVYKSKLQEVEAHLIWMVVNIKSIDRPPPRKRRKPGDYRQVQLSFPGFQDEQANA
jgi:hypothetical protein